MADRYGPNDLMPCGTDPARRRHLARGEVCEWCGTDVWPQERCQRSEEVTRR